MTQVKLLLDVDGVLNAVTRDDPHDQWTWKREVCSPNGVGYVITHSREMGKRLANLDLDIHWLTTWEHEANKWISPLFDWPQFPVLERNENTDMWSINWWKLSLAKPWYKLNPGPFIWADDDLDEEACEWCESVGGLPVIPKTRIGLTPEHLVMMQDYIDLHTSRAAP